MKIVHSYVHACIFDPKRSGVSAESFLNGALASKNIIVDKVLVGADPTDCKDKQSHAAFVFLDWGLGPGVLLVVLGCHNVAKLQPLYEAMHEQEQKSKFP